MNPAAVLEQELLARERALTQKHTRREGGETQSGVQRSGRATRERVLREVRDVAEREIDKLRSDVFEQLRAEIHGKRTGDPAKDATRMTFTKRGRRRRRRSVRK